MDAKQQAFEKAKKLKEEVQREKAIEGKQAQEADNQLAVIKGNSTLSELYKENADVGTKNLAGALPLLKVHATGKSSKNELADGSEPNDGHFFYKPTKEQFETVECHILTIGPGFRAKGLQADKPDVFNQIMAGVMVQNDNFAPFMMYFTGLKLSRLWEFGKEAGVYTKNRELPIPMFALRVKLSTEKVKTDYGNSWVINFEIIKGEEGFPVIVTDETLFRSLRSAVTKAEDTIASLIQSKTSGEQAEEVPPVIEGKAYDPESKEPIDPNDIPF